MSKNYEIERACVELEKEIATLEADYDARKKQPHHEQPPDEKREQQKLQRDQPPEPQGDPEEPEKMETDAGIPSTTESGKEGEEEVAPK